MRDSVPEDDERSFVVTTAHTEYREYPIFADSEEDAVEAVRRTFEPDAVQMVWTGERVSPRRIVSVRAGAA